MEGSQTLEAIFISSASSDRLPSAPLRRISAALLARTPLHSFEQYVILSESEISDLSMMGLKMTSNGLFISVTRRVQNMLRYERSGKSSADPKYD